MEPIGITVRCVPADQSCKPKVFCYKLDPASIKLSRLREMIITSLGVRISSISFSLQGRELHADDGESALLQIFGGAFQQELRAEYEVIKEEEPTRSDPIKNPQPEGEFDFMSKIERPTYTILNDDPELICAICHDVLMDPIELPCEHSFCRSTCLQISQASLGNCPICRKPWTRPELREPHRYVCRSIERIEVKCSCCGSKVLRGLKGEGFEKHVKEQCSLSCPNSGCTWSGPLNIFGTHIIQDCAKIRCTNSECTFVDTLDSVKSHLKNDCPHSVVSCPMGCGESLKRRDVATHVKELCPTAAAEKRKRHEDELNAQFATANLAPDEFVHLKVSGKTVDLAKEIITRFPGSLLCKLVSKSAKRDQNTDRIYLNRPEKPFLQMVTWLQTGVFPSAESNDMKALLFWKELCFWRLNQTPDASPVRQGLFRDRNFSGQSLVGVDFSNCKIERCNFELSNLTNATFDSATIVDVKFEGSFQEMPDGTKAFSPPQSPMPAGMPCSISSSIMEADASNAADESSSQRAGNAGYDYLFKIVLAGDSKTGKSCLLSRFVDKKFCKRHIATIGVEFESPMIQIGDAKVKLQIWDTAGEERYRSITHSYYRGAHGFIIIFDVNDIDSYHNVPKWLRDAKQYAGDSSVNFLVGNKSDLDDTRQVSFKQAKKLADSFNLNYLETSAKDSTGVKAVFTEIAKAILANHVNESDLSWTSQLASKTGIW